MDRETIKKITLGFGIFYAALGILGFIPGITTPAPGPVPGSGYLLGIFAVNTIHNIAHLLLGAILIYGGTAGNAIQVNRIMAVIFVVLVIASIIAPLYEGIAINLPDTLLHLFSAALTGYLGFMGARDMAVNTR